MTNFMAAEMGEGEAYREGGQVEVREKSSSHLIAHIPSFYDKIKLPDLIKPCDVFVKLEKGV